MICTSLGGAMHLNKKRRATWRNSWFFTLKGVYKRFSAAWKCTDDRQREHRTRLASEVCHATFVRNLKHDISELCPESNASRPFAIHLNLPRVTPSLLIWWLKPKYLLVQTFCLKRKFEPIIIGYQKYIYWLPKNTLQTFAKLKSLNQ